MYFRESFHKSYYLSQKSSLDVKKIAKCFAIFSQEKKKILYPLLKRILPLTSDVWKNLFHSIVKGQLRIAWTGLVVCPTWKRPLPGIWEKWGQYRRKGLEWAQAPENRKDKQSVPSKGEGWGGTTQSGVIEEDRCKQSEQLFDRVEFYKCDCRHPDSDNCLFLFFRENKSYGIKTTCIDPLSTCYWSSSHK